MQIRRLSEAFNALTSYSMYIFYSTIRGSTP